MGDAVSSEDELPVAAVAGEMDALFDQTRAQARTARVGLYQEVPELCDLVAPTDDEDAVIRTCPMVGIAPRSFC